VLISLDPTEDAVQVAATEGYTVLLTHHPLLFRGLHAVDGGDTGSRKVIRLIQAGVTAMSFHTRLDAADGGVNDTLAALLGLEQVRPFGATEGEDANPAGKPLGRIGTLPCPESMDAFVGRVKAALHLPGVLCAGCGKPVSRVAVLGGAGDDDVDAAMAAGADTYLTGELRYHHLCDAPFSGMNLLAAGHYHTEFPVTSVLARLVEDAYRTAKEDPVPLRIIGSNRVRWM
jgi:dinuclear metal center YbgI/SA1388 family protein